MILKPVTSEKAVKLIDLDNTILFEVEKNTSRDEIKDEVEKKREEVKETRSKIREGRR